MLKTGLHGHNVHLPTMADQSKEKERQEDKSEQTNRGSGVNFSPSTRLFAVYPELSYTDALGQKKKLEEVTVETKIETKPEAPVTAAKLRRVCTAGTDEEGDPYKLNKDLGLISDDVKAQGLKRTRGSFATLTDIG